LGLVAGGELMSATVRIIVGFIALATILGIVETTSAQSQPNVAWCNDPTATDDQTIAGCTAEIESGGLSGNSLAIAFYNRGLAYANKGQTDRAIQDFDQAIRLDPQNAGYWDARCWGRALAGQLEQAIKDCDESLRLKPNDANTLDSRGFAYLKSGAFDKAIADYDAALKINPKLASSLYGRGLAKQKKGDKAGADADVAAAKAIDAKIAQTFAGYGVK